MWLPVRWTWQPNWLPNHRSFVYGRLQELPPAHRPPKVRQKVRSYLHVIGTDAEKDPPVFGYGVVPSIDVDPRDFASLNAAEFEVRIRRHQRKRHVQQRVLH